MKLARIIDPAFQRAVQVLLKQPLPLKTAYKLRGIIRKIDDELNKYEEVRKEALSRYGKKNANGTLDIQNGIVQFEGDSMKEFLRGVNDLTSTDVEISTISIGELGDNLVLSAQDLILLEGLIVD
jgi:hypothetical protein